MANALSSILTPSWKDQFTRLVGQTPDSLGIQDEAHAQQVALQIQQMRNSNMGGLSQSSGNWGSMGTRNESQYPTR